MVSQITGAFVRALLVMVLIATPSLMLPSVPADTTQIVALVSLFAAALTFFEYASTYPGLVEFRDAPPFNRVRFLSLFITVLLLSTIVRGQTEPTTLTDFIETLGGKLGSVIDVPYSPVRLVVLMLPDDMSLRHLLLVRTAAGLSYLISLTTLIIFVATMRIIGWPTRMGTFNVWINLPTFDPTTGGDVVERLERDARFNIALGFLSALPDPGGGQGCLHRLPACNAGKPANPDLDDDRMGLSSCQSSDARHRDGPHRRHDRGKAPSEQPCRRSGNAAGLSLAAALLAPPVLAAPLRIATFNAELSRDGPGLLLRDIQTEKDPQVEAAASVVALTHPDILILTGFDYDYGLAALGAFASRIEAADGPAYSHLFALRPNTGMPTGLDLDGDGRLGGPGDAQGFGRFSGEGGMAILSRWPLGQATDYSAFLWRDLPGALIDGAELSADAIAIQRLSTTGHWAVPVELPDGTRLTVLTYLASPPVFDGPEDRNGRRNHDETAFWSLLLDGALPYPAPAPPVVIAGDANLDPVDGDGRPEALVTLLEDRRFNHTSPASKGGPAAARAQGGVNAGQGGDPALDTADWPDDGPGNLRVDYVLPSAALSVTASGVFWPAEGQTGAEIAAKASRHRLVWVEVETR